MATSNMILAELEQNNVSQLIPDFCRTESALTFIGMLLKPAIHEQKIVPFGVVFVPSLHGIVSKVNGFRIVELFQPEISHRLADGKRSFMLFENVESESPIKLLCLDNEVIGEAEMVELATQIGGVVGRVDDKGAATFCFEFGTAICDNRNWLIKRPISSILGKLKRCVPQANEDSLRLILEFCYHTLSPLRIGATIVWLLDEISESEMEPMRPKYVLDSSNFSIAKNSDAQIMKHFLSAVDGALIIDKASKVVGAAAHLKYSLLSQSIILQREGTRHTSAQRFSFDQPKVIVFVVSSDGPVSVFSDGARIGALSEEWQFDSTSLKELVPAKRDDITGSSAIVKCKKCGKLSVVSTVVVIGWKDRESTNCAVCGETLDSAMCFSINSYVIKDVSPTET